MMKIKKIVVFHLMLLFLLPISSYCQNLGQLVETDFPEAQYLQPYLTGGMYHSKSYEIYTNNLPGLMATNSSANYLRFYQDSTEIWRYKWQPPKDVTFFNPIVDLHPNKPWLYHIDNNKNIIRLDIESKADSTISSWDVKRLFRSKTSPEITAMAVSPSGDEIVIVANYWLIVVNPDDGDVKEIISGIRDDMTSTFETYYRRKSGRSYKPLSRIPLRGADNTWIRQIDYDALSGRYLVWHRDYEKQDDHTVIPDNRLYYLDQMNRDSIRVLTTPADSLEGFKIIDDTQVLTWNSGFTPWLFELPNGERLSDEEAAEAINKYPPFDPKKQDYILGEEQIGLWSILDALEYGDSSIILSGEFAGRSRRSRDNLHRLYQIKLDSISDVQALSISKYSGGQLAFQDQYDLLLSSDLMSYDVEKQKIGPSLYDLPKGAKAIVDGLVIEQASEDSLVFVGLKWSDREGQNRGKIMGQKVFPIENLWEYELWVGQPTKLTVNADNNILTYSINRIRDTSIYTEPITNALLNTKNGEEIREVSAIQGLPVAAEFHPSDPSSLAMLTSSGHYYLIDTNSGKPTYGIVFSEEFDYPLMWFPDNKRLCAATGEGDLFIFNAETGEKITKIRAHEGKLTQIKMLGNEKYFMSSGRDGIVRFWDSSTYEMLAAIAVLRSDDWFIWDRSGNFDGTEGAREKLYTVEGLDITYFKDKPETTRRKNMLQDVMQKLLN
ncbi:hypothetical protein K8I28_08970 [bacterium]|nr:hypothetical protein [bacterium]